MKKWISRVASTQSRGAALIFTALILGLGFLVMIVLVLQGPAAPVYYYATP